MPKGGSQKKVKDTGELAKMVNTNTLQEGPDMRSCRKFWTKHLKLGQAKREDRRATRSGVREKRSDWRTQHTADGAAGALPSHPDS